MEHALDALDLAAEVFITASIITIVFSLAILGVQSNNNTTEGLQYYYSKDMYFDYNGSVIDGSTAIYLAETVAPKGEILVKFYTKACPEGFISTDGIKDIRNSKYIDPSKEFLCNAIKDLSDTTVSLQIVEIGTNLYDTTEENLAKEIAKLEKANDILIQSINAIDNKTKNLNSIDTSGISIDTSAQQEYKRYVYYDRLREFYDKWRAEL